MLFPISSESHLIFKGGRQIAPPVLRGCLNFVIYAWYSWVFLWRIGMCIRNLSVLDLPDATWRFHWYSWLIWSWSGVVDLDDVITSHGDCEKACESEERVNKPLKFVLGGPEGRFWSLNDPWKMLFKGEGVPPFRTPWMSWKLKIRGLLGNHHATY